MLVPRVCLISLYYAAALKLEEYDRAPSLNHCLENSVVGAGGDPRNTPCCVAANKEGGSSNKTSKGLEIFYAVNDKTKSLYLKIPKCASSAIYDNHLRKHGYELRKQVAGDPFLASASFDGYCKFTFVRNPIKRHVSGYYSASNRDPNPTELRLPYRNVSGEPARYTRFVQDQVHDPRFISQGRHEQHVVSQLVFLNAFSSLSYSFVGRVEHLNDDWKHLQRVCSAHSIPDANFKTRANARANNNEGFTIGHVPGKKEHQLDTAHSGWKPELDWCWKPACSAVESPAVAKMLVSFHLADNMCFGYDLPQLPAGIREWASELSP